MRCTAPLLIILLLATAATAHAHKPSDSYLTLIQGSQSTPLKARWDISLRDLEHTIGLDTNGDRHITWGELRSQRQAVFDYALARLSIVADAGACHLHRDRLRYHAHSDGGYAVLGFQADCSAAGSNLDLTYDLLFDADPTHRGLIKLQTTDGVRALIARADARTFSLSTGATTLLESLAAYVAEGVRHIFFGYDHLAFLLLLVLPAVLSPSTNNQSAVTMKSAAFNVLVLATAFTAAHSITLSLAVLGVVALPAKPVEIAIAGSVVAAGLLNVWLAGRYRGGWLAFAFGLIHGFGFAGALGDLGLPRMAMGLHLAAFNTGVELGQIAIVAVTVPLLFLARRVAWCRRTFMPGASLCLASLGVIWMIQRI